MRAEKKEVRLTVRLHNNRLKSEREAMGLTQKDTAENIGIGIQAYGQYENMSRSPLDRKTGEWNATALKVACFFGRDPSYLFPEALENVKLNKIEREFSVSEIKQLVAVSQRDLLLGEAPPSPEEAFERSELKQKVSEVLETLDPEEAETLIRRYDLDGEGEWTQKEIGKRFGVSGGAISQREKCILHKLRSSKRVRKELKPFHPCWTGHGIRLRRRATDDFLVFADTADPRKLYVRDTATYNERNVKEKREELLAPSKRRVEAIKAIRETDSDFSSLKAYVMLLRADYTRAIWCFGIDMMPCDQHVVYIDSEGWPSTHTLCGLRVGKYIQVNKRSGLRRHKKCEALLQMSGVNMIRKEIKEFIGVGTCILKSAIARGKGNEDG